MNAKRLIIASLVGGLVLFFWGFVWNALIPIAASTFSEFADNDAVVQVVRENAPENGVYIASQGLVAAISFTPDLADKSQEMGANMAIEFVSDVLFSFLLGVLLMKLPGTTTVLSGAGFCAVGGLAAAVSERVSDWNWYGFSTAFTLSGAFEAVAGWFFVGLVVGTILRRQA